MSNSSKKKDDKEPVFYNFPFDAEYQQLRDVVVFTIMACNFSPICASDVTSSGEPRFAKIITLIRNSRLSIHDLSRTESDQVTGLARFNMPLELGVCIGAQYFERPNKTKRRRECLILGHNLNHHRDSMSDLAGNDISVHKNDPKTAITLVRNWLDQFSDSKCIGGMEIYKMYLNFRKYLPEICQADKISTEELTYSNYVSFVSDWLDLLPQTPNR